MRFADFIIQRLCKIGYYYISNGNVLYSDNENWPTSEEWT